MSQLDANKNLSPKPTGGRDIPSAMPEELNEPPLSVAFHRVMRAVMFAEKQPNALDALPMAQLRLLWTVHFSPEATMKDFSERLGVSQSTVTQLAEQLVRRGLVERQADTNDRRVVRLRISVTGRDILEAMRERQRRMMQTIWEGLALEERESVLHGLDLLARATEAFRAAQGDPAFLPTGHNTPMNALEADSDAASPQPVFDLMARRVRGRAPA